MKKWMMIALAGMTAGVLMTGCGKSETGAVETAVSAAADSSAESAASDESEARASDENAAESTAAESASVTFTDDLGRELTVENPERVAALLGSFADIWYLAGGEVVASADDAWDDFDLPMAEDAINLGMTKDLSLEKLFEADPDLVLASTNTKQNLEWQDTLESAGITVAYFDVSDFEDYLRVLKIFTEITGRDDLYEKNGASIEAQMAEIVEESKQHIAENGQAPKVLVVRASASMILAKNSKGNVMGEMVHALGCENIADSDDSLLENLNLEHIIVEDPDHIFICQFGSDLDAVRAHMEEFIAENPAWSNLTAVKEGHVYYMEKALYTLKPNDRWAEAYEKVEELLFHEEN